jgi:hypothetical protein
MAVFTENANAVLSKQIDNETYYLVPLAIDSEIRVNVENPDTMFAMVNTDDNIQDKNTKWIKQIQNYNFSTVISSMLTSCFTEIDANGDIISYLKRDNYVNYAMFSNSQLKHCYEYFLVSEDFDASMISPLSFCSLEFHNDENMVQIKRTQSTGWTNTQHYMIYNVCKNDSSHAKNLCSNMLNMIVNHPIYAEFPLFLFVDPSNEAAVKCYTKNMFQKVVDVFTSEQLPHGENNIYMCYNKYTLKLTHDTQEFQLSPSIKTRIALVAHGALMLTGDEVFKEGFIVNEHKYDFYYPFENLQFYTQLGKGLLSGMRDESAGIFGVCYEKLIAAETLQPSANKWLNLHPMQFSGFNKYTDPPSREFFIGFYDCNQKKRIKENTDLFEKTNKDGKMEILTLDNVFSYLYKHCVENDIDISNVELKIFACRGFCPVGEFAMTAQSGGDDDNMNTNVEQSSGFQPSDEDSFYNFLLEQPKECELVKESDVAKQPEVGGGKKNKKLNQKSKQKTKRFLSKTLRKTLRKKM